MTINRIGLTLAVSSLAELGLVLAVAPSAPRIMAALAVLLPAALAWLLVARAMAPLAALGAQTAAGDQRPGSDPRALAALLGRNLHQSSERIRELEQAELASLAEGRLLEYDNRKLQAVLQCLPDGLLLLDPAGELSFATGKIEPLLGVTADAALAQPPEHWCGDPELCAMLTRFRSAGPETRRARTIEFNPRQVPDKRLWASAQPLQDGGGELAFGSLVVLRDATREHLARQAANDFVAHVSHELKSPLNVIGMYGEMLADAAADEATRVEAVNVIQDEVERMNSLVNNLLNVNKLEMGSMRPERHRVKLDELLRDSVRQAQSRADSKEVRLELQVPREMAAVSVDKDLFRIALNNLLGNAIKYNQRGGSVTLAAEETEAAVVIAVRDTGIGMAPEDQARVLEKFFRVRESGPEQRGGHGMGLYLANQIVELHHGRLAIESELGRGSVFSIHLEKMPALAEGGNVL
jgi:signal transduction histidine kinase